MVVWVGSTGRNRHERTSLGEAFYVSPMGSKNQQQTHLSSRRICARNVWFPQDYRIQDCENPFKRTSYQKLVNLHPIWISLFTKLRLVVWRLVYACTDWHSFWISAFLNVTLATWMKRGMNHTTDSKQYHWFNAGKSNWWRRTWTTL